MYQAYAAEEVVTRLQSFDTVCLASSSKSETLLVGSRQGHLLAIDQTPSEKRNFNSVLHRAFEKKAITDLQVVESHGLVLCLADNQIGVHEFGQQFKCITTLTKYKPISAFVCYIQQPDNRLFVLLCSKRKLYLLKWLVDEFDEVQLQFSPAYLPENVGAFTWCATHSVIFTVRSEYSYVRVFEDENANGLEDETGNIRSLFATSDQPLMVSLPQLGVTGLLKENQIYFVDERASYVPHLTNCRFSNQPISLTFDAPYLIAALPKGIVEIRSVQPEMLIQRLSFARVTLIHCAAPGYTFAASESAIWKLNARPAAKANVRFLANERHFELATAIAEQMPNPDAREMVALKRKTALNLFQRRSYAGCFNIHLELGTDVLLVLHFLDELLPAKYAARLSKFPPLELEDFEGNTAQMPRNELKLVIADLCDYLSARRTDFARQLAAYQRTKREARRSTASTATTPSTAQISQRELQKLRDSLELVDTALLKCYLRTKPMLIPSLLRLPDNSCIVEEAVSDLRERHSDLFLLFEKKHMHRDALELLKAEAVDENSTLAGLEPIIEYLQTLSGCHLDLVFEFADWVLTTDLQRGTEIFCPKIDATDGDDSNGPHSPRDSDAPLSWDRDRVLDFLRRRSPAAVVPYLEFLVGRCGEQRAKFHEALADQYVNAVRSLIHDYVHALGDNELRTKAGAEDGELGAVRSKLLRFLHESHFYSAVKVLHLLDDHLLEEKAIVLGRLKRHEEALAIYTNILMDYETAEQHCVEHFNERDEVNRRVFFMLFSAYVRPGDIPLQTLAGAPYATRTPKANVPEALKILRNHAAQMNTIDAIRLIPPNASLGKVWNALESVLETTRNRARATGILVAVSKLAREKAERRLSWVQSTRITIDQSVECVLCRKRIGTSAFVRYPNGNIAHFFCYRKSIEPPAAVLPAVASSSSLAPSASAARLKSVSSAIPIHKPLDDIVVTPSSHKDMLSYSLR